MPREIVDPVVFVAVFVSRGAECEVPLHPPGSPVPPNYVELNISSNRHIPQGPREEASGARAEEPGMSFPKGKTFSCQPGS